MKNLYLVALVASLFLTSCGSAQYHINQAEKHNKKVEKHIKKAVLNGANFTDSTDTVTVNSVSIDTLTVNDTVYINSVETVVKTVVKTGEVRYVSRADKRKEHRLEKQNKRLTEKNKRLEARLASKNQRSSDKTKRVTVRNNKKKLFDWKILLIIALLIINIYLWITKK